MTMPSRVPSSSPAPDLPRLQILLARLMTDADAVEALRDGRQPAWADGDDVATALTGVNLDQLLGYAQSLEWKRTRDARHLLPYTSAALGCGFGAAFLPFARRTRSGGNRKPLADAMAFACELATNGREPQTRDAARYDWESLNLSWRLDRAKDGTAFIRGRRGFGFRLQLFDHPLAALDPLQPPSSWPRRATVVLFARGLGKWGIWYW
jgi:hypothetical protein